MLLFSHLCHKNLHASFQGMAAAGPPAGSVSALGVIRLGAQSPGLLAQLHENGAFALCNKEVLGRS